MTHEQKAEYDYYLVRALDGEYLTLPVHAGQVLTIPSMTVHGPFDAPMLAEQALVPPHAGCQECGERIRDRLVWIDHSVECQHCGNVFEPRVLA